MIESEIFRIVAIAVGAPLVAWLFNNICELQDKEDAEEAARKGDMT